MSIPYIPGYPGHTSGTQKSVTRIVIHCTVSPTVRGGARSVAKYFQKSAAGGSAHYIVDPGEIVRCYAESTVCWHAPPNTGSIGIELCDPQKGSSSRWGDADHEAMLKLAADLVRDVAKRWGVPLRRLSAADLKAGRHGICGHVDVAAAFHQTDHSDPGTGFPWAHFMELIGGDAGEDNDDMEPTTRFKIDNYWAGRGQFSHDEYAAGFLWTGAVSETRTYGKAILAKLEAQNETIKQLSAAVAALSTGQQVDPDVLIQRIETALEQVTVRLDVPDTEPTT